MSRSRYKILEKEYPYFLTSNFSYGLPLFSNPEIARCLIEAIKYHQSETGLKVYAWCFMENHFHIIAQHNNLSRCIQSIKSYSAKEILKILELSGNQFYLRQLVDSQSEKKGYRVWQEGFYPKQIFSDKVLRQKTEYVHYNPVKRGYVDFPEQWRYSSARDYAGEQGLIEICRDIW